MADSPDSQTNSLWRRLRIVLAVTVPIAIVIFFVFRAIGIADDCRPHEIDGQCGMSTFFGYLYGLIGALLVISISLMVTAIRWNLKNIRQASEQLESRGDRAE